MEDYRNENGAIRPLLTPTNVTNAQNFLTYFTPGTGNYQVIGKNQQDAGTLLSLFSADGVTGGSAIPQVAVTEHGMALGPSFQSGQVIKRLFNRLFSTFNNFQIAAINSPNSVWLTSPDANATTVAVQVTLTGSHVDWWFSHADNAYSQPLSGILPANKLLQWTDKAGNTWQGIAASLFSPSIIAIRFSNLQSTWIATTSLWNWLNQNLAMHEVGIFSAIT
jgi:hypothetical protein